jgi:hypothetical protein
MTTSRSYFRIPRGPGTLRTTRAQKRQRARLPELRPAECLVWSFP